MNNNRHAEPRLLVVTTVATTIRAFLIPIAKHFQQKGWRVDAVANGVTRDELCRSSFGHTWDAEWGRNPIHPSNFLMFKRIRELALQNEYDIVHVHTPVAAFVARLALAPLRQERNLQVLYTAHGFHFHPAGSAIGNRVFESLERKAAKWTDFLIVINREDCEAAKAKRIIDRKRLKIMPGIGVDRNVYSSAAVSLNEVNRIHEELGINASTPVLLMVAEFTKRKRHADAIRAFAKMIHRRARLVLAGNGPLLEEMKQLAIRLGVGDRLHFLGSRTDVPVLMRASRAVILPSSQEGLPRSILEAMSMGVPVIGTRVRGTTELLERNAGLLVDVGDIDQLAHSMQMLLDDRVVAEMMGRTGRLQSEAYDLSHILRMHEELYEEALERRQAASSDIFAPPSSKHD